MLFGYLAAYSIETKSDIEQKPAVLLLILLLNGMHHSHINRANSAQGANMEIENNMAIYIIAI